MTETTAAARMTDLATFHRDLSNWLLQQAMPAWTDAGFDSATGRFAESIDLTTGKDTMAPARSRVPFRQIYSVVEAGRLGWQGDWAGIADKAATWARAAFLLENDTLGSTADVSGKLIDPTFDLYNQAFALFALGHLAKALPDRRDYYMVRTADILSSLLKYYRHPELGFQETMPPSAPLKSNPHMHLFEASRFLETMETDTPWYSLSDELAELALTHLILPEDGGLRELFNLDWSAPEKPEDRYLEPGHQFEWAWLLSGYARSRDDDAALAAARSLYDLAKANGVCPERQVVIMQLDTSFKPLDPIARLWGQTEWGKAALALAQAEDDADKRAVYLSDAVTAFTALQRYLFDAPAGLWRDKLKVDNTFVEEPAPASSFYHIVCAISELADFVSHHRL